MSDIDLRHYNGTAAKEVFDDLVGVYAVVYDVPPYAGDPFFSVETYAERLRGALEMDGFETVTARVSGELVGYVHGVTLPADRAWWVSLGDHRPQAAREAADEGRVFWLREIMVLPTHTDRGIGRRLHDEIVAGRVEPWTTLTCIFDNEPARSAYPRWGYEVIGGRIKHAPESPTYDAMILPPAPIS
ncbi:GNAT superfamily N-acetyltransferase [Kitasatospora sp. MAP12-15]|uniref:GNAT family N-acetyltransferase n=1 Tax=unclassified Kitasatospora TaxID=2633591 RepID=UPI0024756921|nr:GNAT family N-acetyltransferase [Kitasatospora sp. MAP12-44]MDH6111901.1 GNAT superfamily N-acetyltransferase [Kitasatospora sp. MAP12-44]